MAEAIVENPSTTKFFCHRCNDEISNVLPGFKCPNCNSGFIEVLEQDLEAAHSSDSSDDEETPVGVNLDINSLFRGLRSMSGNAEPEPENEAPGLGMGTRRRRPMGDLGRSTRRRTNIDYPPENIITDFIMNLTSNLDIDSVTLQGHGSPIFLFGNPGDYAFGRAGLDAIVTQLLNQMDGSGPPPLAKERINEIPVVPIEQSHIDKSMQCSVCWEDFKLGESVRKLVCEHLYHGDCITPWLQLHGTCPVCRKALNEENTSTASNVTSSENSRPGTSAASSISDQQQTRHSTQSGGGLLSSILGTLTSALSGGSSASAPSSTSSGGAARDGSSRLFSQRGERSEDDGRDASSQENDSNRHRQGHSRYPYFDEDFD